MNFKERLGALLTERRELRDLSQALRMHRILGNQGRIGETQKKIAELVQEPLHLSPRDTLAPHWVAESACNMLGAFSDPKLFENPSSYWDGHGPLHGVGLSWSKALRDRLIALCGPLDATVSEMLAGAS